MKLKKNDALTFILAGAVVAIVALATFLPSPMKEVEAASDNSATSANAEVALTEAQIAQKIADQAYAEAKAAQAEIDRKYDEGIKQIEEKSNENKILSIDGTTVRGQVDGYYMADSVAGVAITTPSEYNSESAALSDLKCYTWNVSPQKSNAAYATANDAASSVNGTLGPVVEIDLGTKKGDFTDNGDKYLTTIGIPKAFYEAGATYVVGHVMPGGKFEILENKSLTPRIVQIEVSKGIGAYALIKLPAATTAQ